MNGEEKNKKIQEIEQEFIEQIKIIEKKRDKKIQEIKKQIDQRRIDEIIQDLKNNI